MILTLSADMRLYRKFSGLLDQHYGGAIAIGNFDGLHCGHRKVIETAGSIARKNGIPWGVLTFEPHPRAFFYQEAPPFRLTPFRSKVRCINEMGVDFIIVLRFDTNLAGMSAEDFLANVLSDGLRARKVVSGSDFVFGNKRKGTLAFLKSEGTRHGIESIGVSVEKDNSGEVISSTRIREFLEAAKPKEAARLLGREFEIEGRVVTGDQRGRKIGFPTANLEVEAIMQPALGGYAVRAGVRCRNKMIWYDGISNLGYRPTFEGKRCLLETHVFDFDQDIYGKYLRVSLVEFIRPEQKFDGIEALKAQILADTVTAKEMLAQNRN